MLTALVILGVLASLFLAAALATRDSQALAPAPPDAADVVLPERVGADDVRGLRFGLAARGYRMSEVDAALERLAGELEERDRRIASLTAGDAADGPVEVDGIMTAGLADAGAGMDPLLPSVPAPDAVEGAAPPAQDPAQDPAHDPAQDPAALAAGEAGAAAVDVPAVPHADDAFTGASDAPTPPSTDDGPAGAADAPDVSVGEVPREPVDPPARPV